MLLGSGVKRASGFVLAVALCVGPVQLASPAAADRPLRQRVAFGAWVGGMTGDPSRLTSFERLVRSRADIASYYWGHGDVFPGATELAFADGGRRRVLLSWDMGPTRFTDWTDGSQDAYLDQIMEAAAVYPYEVHVRPWPEMNGDWQSFQPTADGSRPYGGTYAEFRAAWRYVVDYARDHDADNLRWVFNPTADTYAATTHVRRIWPGRRYVDVLGLDGFNWGEDRDWGRWTNATRIFRRQYRRLTELHPRAPVWICEISSKEPRYHDGAPADATRSKGRWIRNLMGTTRFPRAEAVIWFQERKERDWRVDSSRGSLRAVRRALR